MKMLDRVEVLWAEEIQPRIDAVPTTLQDRLVGAVLFFPTSIVLTIAMLLTPNPSGYGTHLQLGMGSCTFLTLFGIPCPMCGMTTTFTHLAHLHVLQGTLNQPFGFVLFLCTAVGAVVGFLELVAPRGRWRPFWRWIDRHETGVAAFLLLGMMGGWMYKIALMKGMIAISP
jgi:hypothetical protein